MPKISKRLMRRLMKKSKNSSSFVYPWICVSIKPKDTLFPEKMERARKMFENIRWHDPRFGPDATK